MVNWKEVKIDKKIRLNVYKNISPQIMEKIEAVQERLKGLSVLHLNATSEGGGVAELLNSQVAFEQKLGLDSRWLVMQTPKDFFEITKKMHNFLQGDAGNLTKNEKEYYLQVNKELGQKMVGYLAGNFKRAVIVVHDPQPLALVGNLSNTSKVVLRLHIDLKKPNRKVLNFLVPYMNQYQRVVISNSEYISSLSVLLRPIEIVEPAIDPLTKKNKSMGIVQAWSILKKFGLDPNKKLITQVSRFDTFKDPMGVVKAFKKLKRAENDAQLVLAGFAFAKDDPEAKSVYKQTKRIADGVKDVNLFIEPKILQKNKVSNDEFINALYTASDIVVQNSKREGFGLTITEAMWKSKPVVAGNADGARLQISNNKNGIIVNSVSELANALMCLLDNQKLRKRLGEAARESVRSKYLLPRYIYKHLKLYAKLKR